MLNAINTAANAMVVQSQKLDAIAQSIASIGATPPANGPQGNPATPVHIGALPLGDAIETIVSLKEVELAYRMNAAVIGTALTMIDSLLEIVEPHKDCR